MVLIRKESCWHEAVDTSQSEHGDGLDIKLVANIEDSRTSGLDHQEFARSIRRFLNKTGVARTVLTSSNWFASILLLSR